MSLTDILDLLQTLIIVVALLVIHRSVPVSHVEKLIEQGRRAAQSTRTPVDDHLLAAIAALWDAQQRDPAEQDDPDDAAQGPA